MKNIAMNLKHIKLIIAEQKCIGPKRHGKQYCMFYNTAAELEYHILKTNCNPVSENNVWWVDGVFQLVGNCKAEF